MLEKFRSKSREESGFTLVELLVVMLILGILAAIAVPSFFNQRDKAKDADAKAAARTSETAMETYATANGGSYSGADATELNDIESTLPDTGLSVTPNGAGDGYTVAVTSETGNVFSIARDNAGNTTFTCTAVGEAGCPSNGNWAE